MAAKVLVRGRIATNNLMSLPKNKNVGNALNASKNDPIVGIQECSPPDFKTKVKRMYPNIIGLGPIHDDRYASPLRIHAGIFRHLKKGSDKLYSGVGHVSLTRHLTWAVAQYKSTKTNIGVINLHAVVYKNDKYKAKRLAMRNESKAALKKRLKWMVDQGLPVIITGDFNDRANWLGSAFEGMRVTRVTHGIDQILFVDSKTARWGWSGRTVENTSSDHHVLSVNAILYKK